MDLAHQQTGIEQLRQTLAEIPALTTGDKEIIWAFLRNKAQNRKTGEINQNTWHTYRRGLGHFLSYLNGCGVGEFAALDENRKHPGEKSPRRILADYPDYISTLRPNGKPYGERSAANFLAIAKSFLKFCFTRDHLEYDHSKYIETRTVNNSDIAQRITDTKNIRRMLDKATNPQERLLLQVLYITWMRVSEIIFLQFKNVELRNDETLFHITGKGGKARTVKIKTPHLFRTVKLFQRERGAGDDAFLFITATGNRLQRSQVGRIVKKLAKRANVTGKISPHWFRHTGATDAINGGAPIHTVKDGLGHSSISTTEIYLHVTGESAAAYLDSTFFDFSYYLKDKRQLSLIK